VRILFALPYVPSLIRVRPYNFIRALARRHEVTVLATSMGGEAEDLAALQAFCEAVHLVPFRPGTALRSCARAALRGEPLQAAVCRSPEAERRLRELLVQRRFDVVHVEHLRAAYLGKHIPPDLPAVFDAVDSISLLLERTLQSSHSLRQRVQAAVELRRTRRYEAGILRRFSQVAVTSPDDAATLLGLEADGRVTVVPNGVDLEYFGPVAGPRETATIVFSGKMSYHANATAVLHFVRHILPLIRRVRPDVRVKIVGSRPPASIRALAADPAIAVTGHVPDIRAAIGRSILAICPVTVKVGIQNKVLEAMAMGLPVVSTLAGVGGLAAEPGREILVADDATAFAAQVCRLLADPQLCQRVGMAGRRYVEEHHRWDAAANRLEGLYYQAQARALVRA
jgi:polysaccharide biosynthesis protein PslH